MKEILKVLFVSLLLFATAQKGFASSAEAGQVGLSSDHSSLAQVEGGNDQAASTVEPSLAHFEIITSLSRSSQVIKDLVNPNSWWMYAHRNRSDENRLLSINSSATFLNAYRLLLLFPFHSFP